MCEELEQLAQRKKSNMEKHMSSIWWFLKLVVPCMCVLSALCRLNAMLLKPVVLCMALTAHMQAQRFEKDDSAAFLRWLISVLLIPSYVYCLVYGLTTHIHICYMILIIRKYFYNKNFKELIINSYLGMEWCWLALFVHLLLLKQVTWLRFPRNQE